MTSSTSAETSSRPVKEVTPDQEKDLERGDDVLASKTSPITPGEESKYSEDEATVLHDESTTATPSPTTPTAKYEGGPLPTKVQTTEEKESATLAFPEGGTTAWLVCLGSAICTFFSFGYINSFGVLAEYYQTDLLPGTSSSALAWISSLQYGLLFMTGLFCGRLFDAGLMRPVLAFGMALFVVTQMLLSLCTKYWHFILCQGIGEGIALGITFSLAICPATHWFNKKRGLAFGVIAAGSSIGGVIFPILCKQLIPKIGFPWTMRIIGFMGLVCLAFAWTVMKPRLPPSLDLSNGGWRTAKLVDPSAFKHPAYTFFVLGCTLILFGLYTPFTFADIFTDYYQLPASGYYLSFLNAASLFGRTIPGFLSDRFGRFNTVLPHLYLCAILAFVYPLCTTLAPAVIFAILYGFGSGCYVSLIPACAAQLGGATTSNAGTRIGMLFGVMSIGGLFGTPLTGAIIGSGENLDWWGGLGVSGGFILAGTLCLQASRQLSIGSWTAIRRKF